MTPFLPKIRPDSNAETGPVFGGQVNPATFDVGQELLQAWPLHVAAGEPAVAVVGAEGVPAGVALAGDVGLGRLPLGVQAVEVLVEALLVALAAVDGAPHGLGFSRRRRTRGIAGVLDHRAASGFCLLRPKNSGPLQCVPVMALATADSDLYRRPL